MKKKINLYNGPGTGKDSIKHTLDCLNTHFPEATIHTLGPEEVLAGKWTESCDLFVMPGGSDLFYLRHLKGKANDIIKNYVENGGSYLGICAGAYYGCDSIEFDRNGPLKVVGKRELGFFPGKAIGPLLAPYDYKTNSGCRAVLIKTKDNAFNTFFNGGCYFENADDYSTVEVIAHYEHQHLPTIVSMPVGKGKVILSGVHFEFNPELMDQNDPYFEPIIPSLQADQDKIINLQKTLLDLLKS